MNMGKLLEGIDKKFRGRGMFLNFDGMADWETRDKLETNSIQLMQKYPGICNAVNDMVFHYTLILCPQIVAAYKAASTEELDRLDALTDDKTADVNVRIQAALDRQKLLNDMHNLISQACTLTVCIRKALEDVVDEDEESFEIIFEPSNATKPF